MDHNLLLAQYNASKTARAIHQTVSGGDLNGRQGAIESLQQQILQIEAEAEATSELSTLGNAGAEREFALLEANSDVERALFELKQRVAPKSVGPASATPIGEPTVVNKKVSGQ